MIRFMCPTCLKHLKAPDDGAGRKIPCPRCGQRLQVPTPPQPPEHGKTVLGSLLPPVGGSGPVVAAPLMTACPSCGQGLKVPDNLIGQKVRCARCGVLFAAGPATAPSPRQSPPGPAPGPSGVLHPDDVVLLGLRKDREPEEPEEELEEVVDDEPRRGASGRAARTRPKHSGLGMASFIIALLVGGLDVLLGIVIATQIATSEQTPRGREWETPRARMKESAVAGGLAMYCLNCMSVPVCLVGVGLAVVGLVAHRGANHLFTWIGLFGNGVVILGVVGVYVFASILRH
jgi:DNA-directed RNA polymerase subunit RPC12/RpoP